MTAAESQATFYKDVLPILQKNCQNCHRPGQIAPMSFLTYSSVRPWAKAMKAAVVTRKMPPWFADPQYGHFSNDRSLPQSEIDTIVKWVDSGAPEGNPADAPAAIHWPENNWQVQPDVIVDVPPFKVPASGLVEWTNITVPNPFKKDTWVTAILVRPDNVAVTHHIGVLFKPHTGDTAYNAPRWTEKKRDKSENESPRYRPPQQQQQLAQLSLAVAIEAIYVPGMLFPNYIFYKPEKLIPADVDLDIQ